MHLNKRSVVILEGKLFYNNVSTKKKFTWKFSLDNIEQELTLYVSQLSGKKKITLNGRIIREESK